MTGCDHGDWVLVRHSMNGPMLRQMPARVTLRCVLCRGEVEYAIAKPLGSLAVDPATDGRQS